MKRDIKTGDKFGRLTVIKFVRKDDKHQFWLVKCSCGNKKVIRKGDLFRTIGSTISCGCYKKTVLKTHGLGHTRLNNIWSGILTRIRNTKRPEYKYYGEKNITIQKSWLKFENFLKDMGASYIEHCQTHGIKNTTIDRINSNKGYTKANCKWATYKEQNSNKSSNVKYKGETATEASRRLTNGDNPWLVFGRLKRGWKKEKAFTQISRKRL